MLVPVHLGLLHVGSFGVAHVVWEISSRCALKFREISPTIVLVPGALFKNKNVETNNGSGGFKNQGALNFIETKV